MLWRLRLLATWGDPHYLGLDALQVAVVVVAAVVVAVTPARHEARRDLPRGTT